MATVTHEHATDNAYLTTIAAPAIAVQEGDTVVVVVGTRTSSTGQSVSGITDGGSNPLSVYNAISGSGYAYGAIGVKHNCAANAAAVFTATFSTSISYRSIEVFVIHPAAGETPATEVSPTFNSGSGTSLSSPSVSTTKAAIVFALAQTAATNVTFASEQINGGSPDYNNQVGNRFDSWYRSLASAASSFTATVSTGSTSVAWLCGIIAISLESSSVPLTADDVVAGAPSVDQPALSQVHALTAQAVTAGLPAVDSPAIGQTHALSAQSVESGSPSIASPTFNQSHTLAAAGITAGAPICQSPTLSSAGPVVTAYDRATMRLSERQAGIRAVELIQFTRARDLVAHSQEVP